MEALDPIGTPHAHRSELQASSRLLARGVAASGSVRALALILGFTTNVLVARTLTPSDTGSYFIGATVVLATSIVATFGVDRATMRAIAASLARDDAREVRSRLRFAALWGGAVSIVCAAGFGAPATANLLGRLAPGLAQRDVALMLGAIVGAKALGTLRAESFRGLGRIGSATFFEGSDSALLFVLALSGLWLVRGEQSLATVFLVQLLAWIPGLAWGWLRLASYRPLGGESGIEHVRSSRAAGPLMGAHGLASFVAGTGDLLVVGALIGPEVAALYGVASRLALLVSMPLTVVNAALPPMIARYWTLGSAQSIQQVVRSGSAAALTPALVLAVLFFAAGSTVLSTAFGGFYAQASAALSILTIGHLASTWFGSCQYTLLMSNREGVAAMASILRAAFVLAGSVIVAPQHGMVGIAVIATSSQVLVNAASWLACRTLLGVKTNASFSMLIGTLRSLRSSSSAA